MAAHDSDTLVKVAGPAESAARPAAATASTDWWPGPVVWEDPRMSSPAPGTPDRRTPTLPHKPSVDGVEDRFMAACAEGGLYAIYPSRHHLSPKVRVFVDFLARHLSTTKGFSG